MEAWWAIEFPNDHPIIIATDSASLAYSKTTSEQPTRDESEFTRNVNAMDIKCSSVSWCEER
jgi:hypothetical protein